MTFGNRPHATVPGVHLHVSQHGVITGDCGEVGLQDGQGAGESHVAAPTEQGDAGEAEDGRHQRRIRHPAQTFDAALEAACRKETDKQGQTGL